MEHAAKTILWPVLRELMITYPTSQADITLDYGLTDIVAERIDARVRLGEYVDKDRDGLKLRQIMTEHHASHRRKGGLAVGAVLSPFS
ncbi:hypothetical protein [Pseudomonas sp. TMW22090]|uniref:hypothetical protein n=1 Tax=Pseudomonas sp. TMW22090 TaxID=2506434 RepID=UPI001F0DC6C3|nr:hypothetical protein [Pseudomonas sp. TMW22090]